MVNGMKKLKILVIAIFLTIIILQPMIVLGDKSLVFDEGNLFSQEDIINLEEEANNLSRAYNLDIVIVTTNDALGKTPREYADDFYDEGGFGIGNDYDGILFLIDMDNREPYISTTGLGIRYLTDGRIQSIIDQTFDGGLIEGDYYGAAMTFLDGTKAYLQRGIPSDQYNEPEVIKPKNTLTIMEFIISLVVGIGLSGSFFLSTKSRYKMKKVPSHFSYRNNSIVNFKSNEDKLVNTFVTHRVIPKPSETSGSSSSGKSSTHTSSSGRTHGGGGSGGRKF